MIPLKAEARFANPVGEQAGKAIENFPRSY
jgi:hypothetical protein